MASKGWRRITNSFLPCFLPKQWHNIQSTNKLKSFRQPNVWQTKHNTKAALMGGKNTDCEYRKPNEELCGSKKIWNYIISQKSTNQKIIVSKKSKQSYFRNRQWAILLTPQYNNLHKNVHLAINLEFSLLKPKL